MEMTKSGFVVEVRWEKIKIRHVLIDKRDFLSKIIDYIEFSNTGGRVHMNMQIFDCSRTPRRSVNPWFLTMERTKHEEVQLEHSNICWILNELWNKIEKKGFKIQKHKRVGVFSFAYWKPTQETMSRNEYIKVDKLNIPSELKKVSKLEKCSKFLLLPSYSWTLPSPKY